MQELCHHFLGASKANTISSNEYLAMSAYPWPGNVRELKNILERASLLAYGKEIAPAQFLTSTTSSVAKHSCPTTEPAHYSCPTSYSLKEVE